MRARQAQVPRGGGQSRPPLQLEAKPSEHLATVIWSAWYPLCTEPGSCEATKLINQLNRKWQMSPSCMT